MHRLIFPTIFAMGVALMSLGCAGSAPTPTTEVKRTTAAETPPQKADHESQEAWIDAVLGWERLGTLRPGDTLAQVTAALGEPASRGAVIDESETSGYRYQTLSWPSQGAKVTMASTEADAPTVSSIAIGPGSAFKTRLGIGIGSTEAAVQETYGAFAHKVLSSGPYLAIGVEWSWLTFEVRDGKVVAIGFGLGMQPE